MPLFGQSSPKPPSPWSKPPAAPPQKPSWGLFESLGLKSAPTTAPKKEVPSPQQKPGLFGGKDLVPRQEILREARMREQQGRSIVIPGTGGQRMPSKEYTKLLEKQLPSYEKTGSHVSELERKNVLRQMRREDKGIPTRERRVLEEQWGLKGKY